jgi:hypothetical protein
VTDGSADDAVGASIGTIAAPLDPAETASANESGWNSATGASTTGGGVAVTLGIGAASVWETEVDWDDTVKASIDEPPVTMDRDAPKSLDLTAYRTAPTPTPAPRSIVRISS